MTSKLIRQAQEPPFFAGLMVFMVFGAIAIVWQAGGLVKIELQLYDLLMQETQRPISTQTPVIVVPIEEADITNPEWGGYPLRDAIFARVLEKVVASEPAAVGLDVYRDIPVPFDASERDELDKVLMAHAEIVGIFLMGEGGTRAVPAPSVLLTRPQQIGFNDFPRDSQADHLVRRALLFMGDENGTVTGFSLQLAQIYLESKGIFLAPADDGSSALQLGGLRLEGLTGYEGGYVNADARGVQMLIDFRRQVDFPQVTLEELFSDDFDSGLIRDRVVVIGIWAPSIKDTLQTPVGADFPGPKLQAFVTDQLIRDALTIDTRGQLRTLSESAEAFLLFIACCVGVLAGFLSKSTLQFAGTVTACGVLVLGSVFVAFDDGLWVPGFMLLLGTFTSIALVVAYRSSYEKRQNGVLMHIFSQHVSEKIAEKIWEQREDFLEGSMPRPQKLQATVLFCDLRGFTTISESLEPTVLIDWLNEYMEEMSSIITENEGVVSKYIGDAIMAIFGVPLPRTSRDEISADATSAVKAAMEMELALEKLNQKWASRGLPSTKMRIGINTGDMVAGSVGGSQRLEYTVIGDSVNVSSRLESFDRDFSHERLGDRVARTLVGALTREFLNDVYETIKIGDMQLKGKGESLPLFLVCRQDYPAIQNTILDPTPKKSTL